MVLGGLSKRSLRDISGNLVPLAILGFFALWFVLERPWSWDALSVLLVYGLLISLAGLLFVVTYATALAFEADESDRAQ